MSDFGELTAEVRGDIANRLSEARDTPVSVTHVESSLTDNQIVLSIEGNPRELFPELDDELNYAELSMVELKMSVTPSKEFVDFQDAELPEC
ncbi:hypothetical protein [Halopelagius longus]|uniref:Uncharacterized protein n=1 Tax=Halopelagius longus TaxID=1236180 RepID=A0A1H1GRU6_9EURY|nr:hypothetical protein [Halopelagius longus]RDI69517.1 hypothetical protein DWB78_18840 [Halopelagius longus]SDR15942.1 hypothetical protein SAMN05216278_3812 [Halopelagius longus]